MDVVEYQEEAKKTVKWLGTEGADCGHMVIGIFSELNELEDAILAQDPINILEEIGDVCWYLFNYISIRKVAFALQTDVGGYGVKHITYNASKLADTVKKLIIYNKEVDRVEEQVWVQKLVENVANFEWVDHTTGKTLRGNIYKAFEKNIAKLNKIRYKNAQYSDQAAQVRDLGAERKELES